MKSLLVSIVITSAIFGHIANANEVTNKNQAFTACKTYVEETVSDFHRSKLKKTRNRKNHFAVRLTVSHGDQKEVMECNIDKSTGTITLIK